MNPALESLVPDPFIEVDGEQSVFAQLLAFAAVGGSGAVAFVALSTLSIELHTGVANWVVSTLCYALLIVPVYLLHRRFSFRSEAPHRHALPRYVSVQIGALLLASLFSYVTYHLLALQPVWASLIVTGLTSGVSFAVLKLWAFTHPAPRPGPALVAPAQFIG
ncbi:MAG: GtrA family protein [Devosia sp.]|nr:GtrA family protein [Devosia sp.]